MQKRFQRAGSDLRSGFSPPVGVGVGGCPRQGLQRKASVVVGAPRERGKLHDLGTLEKTEGDSVPFQKKKK